MRTSPISPIKTKAWISRMQSLVGKPVCGLDLFFWTVSGCGILALSVVFNRFGLLHFELREYIAYHLGPGSAWKKIFDNISLDHGTYEGRELSYLIDHFDVLMVALSVKWGFPLFVSATHVFLSVFIGVWIGWFAARDLKLGSLIGLLFALLFWTTPFVYLHFLLRTAKVLAAAAVVVLLVEIHRAFARRVDERSRWVPGRFVFSLMASSWVLSFADRQGFFLLVLTLSLVALQWVYGRDRLAGRITLLLAIMLAIELVYFFWIAPALTRAFFGYASDFSFNRLPMGELFAKPVYFAGKSLELLADTFSFSLGHIPYWAVALLVGSVLGITYASDSRICTGPRRIPLSGVMTLVLFALWAMYALMILRHPPVLWPDIRLYYYWIPSGALVILGVVCGLGRWLEQSLTRKAGVAVLLLLLVFRNAAALPGYWKVLEGGHLHESIDTALEVRGALLSRGDDFFEASAEVEKVPAYHALLPYAPRAQLIAERREEHNRWLFYVYTRYPGAPINFVHRFGGNVDSRFLTSAAAFFESETHGSFIGTDQGRANLRMNLVSNRLRGEAVVHRIGPDLSQPLAAQFSVYAQPNATVRYPRWSATVELPAGKREVVVPYAIDSSHLPANFEVEIPARFAGKLSAGWRNPYVSDIGGESLSPTWLYRSDESVVELDEAALAGLLPDKWRPVRALMCRGRATGGGIELSAGGELWIKVAGVVSEFDCVATLAPGPSPAIMPLISTFWYKAGRLQSYLAELQLDAGGRSASFRLWCAEPGGWLVMALDPSPGVPPITIRTTKVGVAP